MKKTGSELMVFALEQVGVKFTFGIPGVHNTELYDALHKSSQITPYLVTHEGCGSFMADAISRTSDSIGTLAIVPAAGLTHAMSGIGEAYLDGVPMLIITGGIRNDSGKHYQLHQIDQLKLSQGVTKKGFVLEKHEDIIPTVYEAYRVATEGEPGPVLIELPANLQLFRGEVESMPTFKKAEPKLPSDFAAFDQAVELLKNAKKPCIYVGWGAVDVSEVTAEIANLLAAPVSTTLQGLSSFDSRHPLHTGMGFGRSAVPAAENAFKDCDCLLAVGVRFAELATGSYGIEVPENLIHIDINPEVFNKNYKAKVTIEADSKIAMPELLNRLKATDIKPQRNKEQLVSQIAKDKEKYFASWAAHDSKDRVNPYLLFKEFRSSLQDDAIVLADDGTHTFLTEELMPIYKPRHFISPSDFNTMGYCVPATIAAKLANPKKEVVGIVGDGAFMMTCMEILTAATNQIGSIHVIFNDGELGQIAQFQHVPLNRKTCTVLGNVNFRGVAEATGAHYVLMENNSQIRSKVEEALSKSESGVPVILDVKIDYSKKTKFSLGAIKTNLSRFSLGEKVRFIGRAVKRHTIG